VKSSLEVSLESSELAPTDTLNEENLTVTFDYSFGIIKSEHEMRGHRKSKNIK
jgi:hypothetical protein